ncbi:MAG: flagellar hook-associated protein FlgL [Burkholderiales bacterium]
MRLTTLNVFEAGLNNIKLRQRDLIEAQERLISGKQVEKASDDPGAAARAERALAGINRADTSLRSVEAGRTIMVQTESALGDAGELLQQARELIIAAGNLSYSDTERQGLAARLRDIRDHLFSVANRSDGAGSYLFGGQGSSQPPFVETTNGVQFYGTPGVLQGENDSSLPMSTDGSAAWLNARTGNGLFETRAGAGVSQAWVNAGSVTDPATFFATPSSQYMVNFTGAATYDISRTPINPPGPPTTVVSGGSYSSGKAIQVDGMSFTITGTPTAGNQFQITPSTANLSVFDVLDRSVSELQTGLRTSAQMTQDNSDSLRDIDSIMTNLQLFRSRAGDVLNLIDVETGRLEDQKLANQENRSNAEDLDIVQALSDFKNQQNGYDAALKSYSMVQRLSLFQYINS